MVQVPRVITCTAIYHPAEILAMEYPVIRFRYDKPHLKPGERVQITEGAFSQIEAIFVTNDGDERVVLLLNILQQDQKLSFPLEAVRKLA
jgi:transcription antitermination factor NusG